MKWRGVLGRAVIGLITCSVLPQAEHHALPDRLIAPAIVAASEGPSNAISPRLLRRFQPLPGVLKEGERAPPPQEVELGRMLFYETRLSRDGDISCNSCHDLADYGVDHKRFSFGDRGQVAGRNTPTVYNAAGSFAQFWDGRAPNVEEQAKGPIVNPVEMAMIDGARVVARLNSIPTYVRAFRRAFPAEENPVTFDNVGRAIGAFERGLVTPGRWDDFLRGNTAALTAEETEGLKTFLNAGCMICHTGRLLGGSMIERVGVVEPWPNQHDRGRQEVTHAPTDAMMFKVPTLRNIAHTGPYFHDASAATLEDAIRVMARYQLGVDMSNAEVSSIKVWLNALTGDLPLAYVARPELVAGSP